jgi:hypothetical protein
MDTNDVALADEVAQHILNSTDHPALRWDPDRSGFRLRMRQLIPGSYLKETPERRRGFRDALRERLPGWREVGGSRWERTT